MSQDQIPIFDLRRWGVGGVVVVGALLLLGLAAFIDGFLHTSIGPEVVGAVCIGGAILIFVIKSSEEIHIVTAKWTIIGEVGEVVQDADRDTKGLVRVRSELWSAKSETPVGQGTKVRVTRVEGLTAWVAKLEESGAQDG